MKDEKEFQPGPYKNTAKWVTERRDLGLLTSYDFSMKSLKARKLIGRLLSLTITDPMLYDLRNNYNLPCFRNHKGYYLYNAELIEAWAKEFKPKHPHHFGKAHRKHKVNGTAPLSKEGHRGIDLVTMKTLHFDLLELGERVFELERAFKESGSKPKRKYTRRIKPGQIVEVKIQEPKPPVKKQSLMSRLFSNSR